MPAFRKLFGTLPSTPEPLTSKVPEITLYFWIVKVLTTAMGEATSDYLVSHFNPYLAVLLGASGFLAALALQFSVRRYIAWVYWLLVAIVSVFGTMAADVTHVMLGVPYLISSTIFAASLLIVFTIWYRTERTLSIHSITTTRREIFYWATVFATFALGTATGDLTAGTLQLGYLTSGILFAVLFLLPGLAYRFAGLHAIPAFWIAYVMTRPLGASFADWADKPVSIGGLGYGDALVSAVLTGLIVIFIVYLSLSRSRSDKRESALEGDY